jgi:hypothetical protein
LVFLGGLLDVSGELLLCLLQLRDLALQLPDGLVQRALLLPQHLLQRPLPAQDVAHAAASSELKPRERRNEHALNTA